MNQELNQPISAKSILKFTLPSIFMMVILSLYTVIDGAFVARLIGTSAFSSVNIIYPLIGLVIGIGTMFGTGMTAVVSTKMGQGKQKEANQNFTTIIIFTLVIGIVLSVVSILFLDKIVYFLGANEAIYDYCIEYAYPVIFFFSATLLQIQFQNVYVANGQPKIGLIMTIVGGIANIILDYLLIAVFSMGVAGAAIATGLSYAIPAVFGIVYFSVNRKHDIYFVKPKWDTQVVIKSMTNGSSEMVSNLSSSITTMLLNYLMMKFIGEKGVAAISIILYLDFILIAISLGYAIGIAPMISYNYGQEDRTKLKQLHKISTYFCIVVGTGMMMFTFTFAEQLANIFTPKATDVYIMAVTGLRIVSFGYLFKGFNIYASCLFTAFGNGKVSALLSFMRTFVFLVGSILGFGYLLGVNGIWMALPFAEIMAIILSIYVVRTFKKVYWL